MNQTEEELPTASTTESNTTLNDSKEQDSLKHEIEPNKCAEFGTVKKFAEVTILYDPIGLRTQLFSLLKPWNVSKSIYREKRPNSEEFQTKIYIEGNEDEIHKIEIELRSFVMV